MASSKEQDSRTYNLHRAWYNIVFRDAHTADYENQFHKSDFAKFLGFAAAGLGKQFTTIDMGCGVGLMLVEMKKRGLGGTYLGLDYSMSALDLARRLDVETKTTDVASIASNFADCDFANADQLKRVVKGVLNGAKADLIVASWTLQDLAISEQRRCLCEWAKLLRPGGRIVVDWSIHPDANEGRVQKDSLEVVRCDELTMTRGVVVYPETYHGIRFAKEEMWTACKAKFAELVQGTGLVVSRIESFRPESSQMDDVSINTKTEAHIQLQKDMANGSCELTAEELKSFDGTEVVPSRVLERFVEANLTKRQQQEQNKPGGPWLVRSRNVVVIAELVLGGRAVDSEAMEVCNDAGAGA